MAINKIFSAGRQKPQKLQTAIVNEWVADVKKQLTAKPPVKGVDSGISRSKILWDKTKMRLAFSKELHDELIVVLNHQSRKNRSFNLVTGQQTNELKELAYQNIKSIVKDHLRLAIIKSKKGKWTGAYNEINKLFAFSEKKRNKLADLTPPINAHLFRAYTSFMLKGNNPDLRKDLATALKRYPQNNALNYWYAHYEIMAGNYNRAHEVLKNFPRGIDNLVDSRLRPILQSWTTHNAHIPFPCNFYTYRYKLLAEETITQLQVLFQQTIDQATPELNAERTDRAFALCNDTRSFIDSYNERPVDKPMLRSLVQNIRTAIAEINGFINYGVPLALERIDEIQTLFKKANTEFEAFFQNLPTPVSVTGNPPERLREIIIAILYPQLDIAKSRLIGHIGMVIANSNLYWNTAIQHMNRQRYSAALENLSRANEAILKFIQYRYPHVVSNYKPAPTLDADAKQLRIYEKIRNSFKRHLGREDEYPEIFTMFRDRYGTIDLESLYKLDWTRPGLKFKFSQSTFDIYSNTQMDIAGMQNLLEILLAEKIREKIDAPLLLLALVFIPMAKMEAFRQMKQYEKALTWAGCLLKLHKSNKILSEFIEVPFVLITKSRVLLEKADAEYKAGKKYQNPTNNPANPVSLEAYNTYQDVVRVFANSGYYISNVENVLQNIDNAVSSLINKNVSSIYLNQAEHLNQLLNLSSQLPVNPLSPGQRTALKILGKNLLLPNVNAFNNRLILTPAKNFPGHDLFQYQSGASLRESNPQVYAIMLEAKARIRQISAGLNYLGYSDSVVPPWRFSYLVDRARYYADQAKNLQRDYLNFISNAEREEFQEMSASQNITLERMNVATEEARVEQSRAEFEVAMESKELADIAFANAQARLDNYNEYDKVADIADGISIAANVINGAGAIVSGVTGAVVGTMAGGPPGTAAGAIIGGVVGSVVGGADAVSGVAQIIKEGAHREMEKDNLELSIREARQATVVAAAQIQVARASVTVVTLQAQAALMRFQFAQQAYEFLRNRLTNAEMWFRLAHSVREVANTYLRRAIEMAFLAEQVYEFMVDKRVDVIRFDYDNDALGDMLGADYLKADLDYLESHLIFTQKEKQQKVKCTISLARDFPQALQELAENETSIIPVTLEYLEKRFPGLYNIKVAAVELRPLAIMDPTRFSVELNYLGSGLMRVKTNPVHTDGTGEPLMNNFDNYGAERDVNGQLVLDTNNRPVNRWILESETEFPVKTLLRPVETAIFSGLTAGESSSYFQSFSAQQKNAFEDCPAAAGWQIDMSMTANKVVPGSLADMELIFYVTGYYDSGLKYYIENAQAASGSTITRLVSAQNEFADEFFHFQRTGEMDFRTTPDMLTTNERIAELINIGIYCAPSTDNIQFNRFRSYYIAEFKIDAAGNYIEVFPQPVFAFAKNGPATDIIDITVKQVQGKSLLVLIEGDESNPVINKTGGNAAARASASETGTYHFKKPGKNIIITRVADSNRMNEYRSEIYISSAGEPVYPDTVYPIFNYQAGTNTLTASLNNDVRATDVKRNCVVTIMDRQGNIVTVMDETSAEQVKQLKKERTDVLDIRFGLNSLTEILNALGEPLIMLISFSRPLAVSFSSMQHTSLIAYECDFNKLTTNRNNRNGDPDTSFTVDVFPAGRYISPLDNWHFSIEEYYNKFITVYDCNGAVKADLSIFRDVILFLEYKTKRRLGN